VQKVPDSVSPTMLLLVFLTTWKYHIFTFVAFLSFTASFSQERVVQRRAEVELQAGVILLPTLLQGMKISNCARYDILLVM
jgi:hypothetical protein